MANILNKIEEFSGSLTKINNNLSGVEEQGFTAPNVPGGDVNLPFTKVPYGKTASTQTQGDLPGTKTHATSRRHLINWFVPDMGVVRMYVNPENIRYGNRKTIRSTRTKGGFSLQYWGEELPTIAISGNTGSSGIEGINMLYEVYRSEQYAFDNFGASISTNNVAQNIAGNLISSISGSSLVSAIASPIISPPTTDLSPLNVPSLANNAFTIEMYYMGWVFRGYFESMDITEDTTHVFTYSMSFKVTQRRGYRTNFLPWHKTPIGGGGNLGNHYDEGYDQETGTGVSPYYSFRG